MPIYVYDCETCQQTREFLLSVDDRNSAEGDACECGGELHRQMFKSNLSVRSDTFSSSLSKEKKAFKDVKNQVQTATRNFKENKKNK